MGECLDRDLPADIPRPLDADLVAALAPLLQERVTRLDELAGLSRFMFGELPDYPADLLTERIKGDTELAARTLDAAIAAVEAVAPDDWGLEPVEAALRGLQDTLDLKLRKFVSVLYVATMGAPRGIPLFDSVALLGRDEALARLRAARAKLA